MNISATMTTVANSVHWLKSVVAKPVVVIVETRVKTLCRKAASPRKKPSAQSSTRRTTEASAARSEVEAELFVAGERAWLSARERAIEEGEVRAGDEHEEDDRPLRGGAEPLDGAVPGREAAGRDGRERVRDGVVEAHSRVDARPGEPRQHGDLQRGQRDVEQPETLRDLADPEGQLLDLGAGQLGLEQLAAADLAGAAARPARAR